MRVLMFGWEFPALQERRPWDGVLRYGPGAGEERHGNPVRLAADPLDAPVRVGNACRCVRHPARGWSVRPGTSGSMRKCGNCGAKLHIEHVDSLLLPYDTPESCDERRRELERLQSVKRERGSFFSSTQETILRLHGGYGPDLMSEVYRYACAAVAIARKARFDVIHVHDWMTYPAGILVRKLTESRWWRISTRWSTTGAATI